MSVLEVKEVQNNLTYPVYYQLFKNPKYLPCYHFYCEECLERIQVINLHLKVLSYNFATNY